MDDPSSFPALGSAPLRTRGQNVVLSMTNTLSANLLHETRFSYVPAVVDLEAYLQGEDQYSRAGVRGFEETARPGVGGSFPDFAWSGYAAMNGSAFDQRPKTQDLKVWEVTDNVTWIAGRHIAKIGGKFRRWVPLFTDSKQYAGQWNFDGSITANPASPAGTGDAFADFLLGYPRQVTRAFPADTFGGQANYWHVYVQDDFKVTNRLTLNLGVRYEYSPWLSGYRGQVGTFDPSSARPIIVASESDQVDLGSQFAGDSAYALFQNYIQTSSQAGLPLSITKTDRAQFGPRIGFAWRPFGETTVVRGGYGLFYEQESSADRVNNNMVPFRLDQTAFNDQSPPMRTMADFYLGTRADELRGAVDRRERHRAEDGTRSSFQLRHAAGDRAVHRARAELRRQHRPLPERHDEHQHSRSRGLAAFRRGGRIRCSAGSTISTIRWRTRTTRCRRRWSSGLMRGLWYLGVVHVVEEHDDAERDRRGRQSRPREGAVGVRRAAQRRDQRGLRAADRAGTPLPLQRQRRGRRRCSADGRCRASTSGAADGRLRRRFQAIARTRASAASGRTGSGSGRLDEPTVELWFDKTAFALPAQFTYGDSGGSILREDSYKTLDFSLFKQFRIGDHRLQFRAEAFNLTNTPSFNAPNTAIDTAAGGRVTSTSSTPRQMQFALKYEF